MYLFFNCLVSLNTLFQQYSHYPGSKVFRLSVVFDSQIYSHSTTYISLGTCFQCYFFPSFSSTAHSKHSSHHSSAVTSSLISLTLSSLCHYDSAFGYNPVNNVFTSFLCSEVFHGLLDCSEEYAVYKSESKSDFLTRLRWFNFLVNLMSF